VNVLASALAKLHFFVECIRSTSSKPHGRTNAKMIKITNL